MDGRLKKDPNGSKTNLGSVCTIHRITIKHAQHMGLRNAQQQPGFHRQHKHRRLGLDARSIQSPATRTYGTVIGGFRELRSPLCKSGHNEGQQDTSAIHASLSVKSRFTGPGTQTRKPAPKYPPARGTAAAKATLPDRAVGNPLLWLAFSTPFVSAIVIAYGAVRGGGREKRRNT